jgi:hypothetical protein
MVRARDFNPLCVGAIFLIHAGYNTFVQAYKFQSPNVTGHPFDFVIFTSNVGAILFQSPMRRGTSSNIDTGGQHGGID